MKQLMFKKGPLVSIHFLTSTTHILKTTLSKSAAFGALIEGPAQKTLIDDIHRWLNHYLSGSISFRLPLKLHMASPFQAQVIEALQKVPYGKTISYQKLAQSAASPQAARAAGSCCKKNIFPLIIPCHRVILTNGSLGQFLYGQEMKQELLHFEQAILKHH